MLRKLSFFFLISLTFAISGWTVASQPPPNKNTGAQQQTKVRNGESSDNKADTKNPTFLVQVIPAQETQDEANEKRQERAEKEHNDKAAFLISLIQDIITGFLVLITGGLAYYTYRLWSSTQNLSLATKQLVIGAEETSRRELRAYIGTSEGKREVFWQMNTPNKSPIEISVHYINYGKTPAKHVTCKYAVVCLPEKDIASYDFKKDMVECKGSSTVFPSQDDVIACRAQKMYSQSDLNEMRKYEGKKRLFVYGIVEYNDGFADGRCTEFCYEIAWRPGASKPGFYYHKRNNDYS